MPTPTLNTLTLPRLTALAAAVALSLGLAACGKSDDGRTPGEKLDAGIAAASEATQEARDNAAAAGAAISEAASDAATAAAETTSEAAAAVSEAASDAVTATAEAAKEAGQEIKEGAAAAAAATTAAAANAGEALDDAGISASINASLAKDPDLSSIKIDVDTKDGAVTLHGSAPSESARLRATEIANSVKGVRSVDNKLSIKSS